MASCVTQAQVSNRSLLGPSRLRADGVSGASAPCLAAGKTRCKTNMVRAYSVDKEHEMKRIGALNHLSNSSLSRSKKLCLWPRRVVFSFLFLMVAVLWAGCENERVLVDGAIVVMGVVRDKETLKPLDKALVGVVYPEIPDSVLIDSSAFLIVTPEWKETGRHPQTALWTTEQPLVLNGDVMEFLTETREDGFFEIGEFPSTCGSYYECAIKRISRLVAWRSGYRFWRYNVRRDTVSNNTPLNVSIYMEKLDTQ